MTYSIAYSLSHTHFSYRFPFTKLAFGLLCYCLIGQTALAQSNTLEVTASAYTSHGTQTDKTPFLAAWNNVLKPGVKSIAVSRDLIKLGLTNGTKVKIDGMPGEYLVLDKMNKRWENKIDIYMGLDHKKAKDFGKKKVTIRWTNPQPKAIK